MQIGSLFLNPVFCKVQKSEKKPKANFAVTNNNLAPLQHDTVTFSGRKKTKNNEPTGYVPQDVVGEAAEAKKYDKKNPEGFNSDDKKIVHSERGSYKTSQRLYEESSYALGQLKYILGTTFGESVIDLEDPNYAKLLERKEYENKDKPVVAITIRRKSQKSIAEKMGSKHVRGIEPTKKALKDIIGARIIVSGNSTKEGNYALEKLTEAVNKNRIKIASVKNHGQENPKLRYATKAKLNQLVNAARRKGTNCSYTDEPRDSGYLAVHILTDEIADGYSAEIQIMGIDVEKFKNIEDICYKCLAGKQVNEKYAPIKKMFEPLVGDSPKAKLLRAEYLEYIKKAYAYERLKPSHMANEYREFLSIPEDLVLPQELDFNNIAKIKDKIDKGEEWHSNLVKLN